jgi:hypothetical protein
MEDARKATAMSHISTYPLGAGRWGTASESATKGISRRFEYHVRLACWQFDSGEVDGRSLEGCRQDARLQTNPVMHSSRLRTPTTIRIPDGGWEHLGGRSVAERLFIVS